MDGGTLTGWVRILRTMSSEQVKSNFNTCRVPTDGSDARKNAAIRGQSESTESETEFLENRDPIFSYPRSLFCIRMGGW